MLPFFASIYFGWQVPAWLYQVLWWNCIIGVILFVLVAVFIAIGDRSDELSDYSPAWEVQKWELLGNFYGTVALCFFAFGVAAILPVIWLWKDARTRMSALYGSAGI